MMTVTEQFRNSLVSHEAGHFIEYVKSIPQYATSKRQQRKLLSLLVHLGIHSRKDGTTNGELRYREGRLPKGLYERVLLSGIAYTHKIFYQKDKISWREIYAYYRSSCKTDIREYLKIASSPFKIKKKRPANNGQLHRNRLNNIQNYLLSNVLRKDFRREKGC